LYVVVTQWTGIPSIRLLFPMNWNALLLKRLEKSRTSVASPEAMLVLMEKRCGFGFWKLVLKSNSSLSAMLSSGYELELQKLFGSENKDFNKSRNFRFAFNV
jgi:hypothetical protein